MRRVPANGSSDPSAPAQGRQTDGPDDLPCSFCGAATHQGLVKAAFWSGRGLIAIENIPARVCQGCGEQFYDDQTARQIEAVVDGSARPPCRQVTVPVFSLSPAGDVEGSAR